MLGEESDSDNDSESDFGDSDVEEEVPVAPPASTSTLPVVTPNTHHSIDRADTRKVVQGFRVDCDIDIDSPWLRDLLSDVDDKLPAESESGPVPGKPGRGGNTLTQAEIDSLIAGIVSG